MPASALLLAHLVDRAGGLARSGRRPAAPSQKKPSWKPQLLDAEPAPAPPRVLHRDANLVVVALVAAAVERVHATPVTRVCGSGGVGGAGGWHAARGGPRGVGGGAEGCTSDFAMVSREGCEHVAVTDIPKSHRLLPAGAARPHAIRAAAHVLRCRLW